MNKLLIILFTFIIIFLSINFVFAYDSNMIIDVQNVLIKKGYNAGTPDGIYGKKTRLALQIYQKDNNLKLSGIPDQATLSSLGLNIDNYKISAPDRFTIPLKSINSSSTNTRGEVQYITGKKGLIVFSVDCESCLIESPMSFGGSSSESTIWSHGAVHIYKNIYVTTHYKTYLESKGATVGEGGRIISIFTKGSTFAINHLHNWKFESEPNQPLIFKVDKNLGYVHIGGKGTVESPDGKIMQISN